MVSTGSSNNIFDDDDEFFNSFDRLAAPSLYTHIRADQREHSSSATDNGIAVSSGPAQENASSCRERCSKRKRSRSPHSSWSCTECTLLNTGVNRCEACGLSRPLTSVQLENVVSRKPIGIACSQCTFVNPVGSITCEMCDWGVVCDPPVYEMTEPILNRPTVDSACVRSEPSVSMSLSMSPQEVEIEDTDGEESETSSGSSASDSDNGSDDDDVPESNELVQFLQTLEAYPSAELPLAAVPTTMVENGDLRDFQLQALHWLRLRENGGLPSPDTKLLSGSAHLSQHAISTERKEDASDYQFERSSKKSLARVRGGILADHMGLGKTRTLISLCEATRERWRVSNVVGSEVVSGATLIVAPTSLIPQWIAEIKNCVRPVPRILHYYGPKRKKLSLFQVAENYDYVMVSYSTLRSEAFRNTTRSTQQRNDERSGGSVPILSSSNNSRSLNTPSSHSSDGRSPLPLSHLFMIQWRRIILDEAHYIRNCRAKQSRSCFLLVGRSRWAVTATPIQNSVSDVYSLLKFLHVPFFGDVKWWNDEIIRYFRQDLHHPRPTTALRIIFGSLALRRTPSTRINGKLLLELPPLKIDCVSISLSKEERTFYNSVFEGANRKMQNISDQRFGERKVSMFHTAFEMLIRCRQACLHPYIVVAALFHIHAVKRGKEKKQNVFSASSLDDVEVELLAELNQDTVGDKHVKDFIDNQLSSMLKETEQKRNRHRGKSAAECSFSSTEFVQKLVEALKKHKLQEQECVICTELMLSPGILPCAHVYCYECAIHALEFAQRCPTCKNPTTPNHVLHVPPEVMGLPTSQVSTKVNEKEGVRQTMIFQMGAEMDLKNFENWSPMFSSKTQELVSQLRAIPKGEKCVIFSSFITYLSFLKFYLDTHTSLKSELFTGGLSLAQKSQVLKKFRSPATDEEEPTVLLATITACGVGINLECANHCFIMDPNYNPGVEIQAIHRLHRLGQTKPVTVKKFIAANTIEEKVEELRSLKASMSGYCFDDAPGGIGGSPRVAHRLTLQELLAVFASSSMESSKDSSSSSSTDTDDTCSTSSDEE